VECLYGRAAQPPWGAVAAAIRFAELQATFEHAMKVPCIRNRKWFGTRSFGSPLFERRPNQDLSNPVGVEGLSSDGNSPPVATTRCTARREERRVWMTIW
jgi:hypothetical protein